MRNIQIVSVTGKAVTGLTWGAITKSIMVKIILRRRFRRIRRLTALFSNPSEKVLRFRTMRDWRNPGLPLPTEFTIDLSLNG